MLLLVAVDSTCRMQWRGDPPPQFQCLVTEVGILVARDGPINPGGYTAGLIGHAVWRVGDEYVSAYPCVCKFQTVAVIEGDVFVLVVRLWHYFTPVEP